MVIRVISINQLNLNIEVSGQGKTNIILLHGWGQSTKVFQDVAKYLQTSFTIYNVDLPGFGLSDIPKNPFNTEDYANIIKAIIDYYQMNDIIIIGHSFGGRIAIKYTAMYNQVKKLVLVDSAGIVPKKKIIYYIKIYYYKLLKKIFSISFLSKYKKRVLSKFGSTDYKNSDEIMRKILVRVVNEDLRFDLEKILCPTLLVWGTLDNVTPISDAYLMKKKLKDAGIVKIEQAGHFSYLENMNLFLSVLSVFFKENH